MRLLDRLYDHSVRVRRHLGDRVTVGPRQYKVVGYLANVLSIDDDSETDVAVVMRQLLRQAGRHEISRRLPKPLAPMP